jgi:hypothetical protein
MTTVEQGRNADVVCKLDQLRPFEGKAKVGLYGLPPAVVAEPAEKEITKDDKEVIFHVKIAPNSPAGQHKSIFAQVLVPGEGDTMAHSVGSGGVMRIDTPPPPKKDGGKTADAPKAGEPAKRLSRLEQLRQEATREGRKQVDETADGARPGRASGGTSPAGDKEPPAVSVYPAQIELSTSRDRQSYVVQMVAPDGVTRDVTDEAKVEIPRTSSSATGTCSGRRRTERAR